MLFWLLFLSKYAQEEARKLAAAENSVAISRSRRQTRIIKAGVDPDTYTQGVLEGAVEKFFIHISPPKIFNEHKVSEIWLQYDTKCIVTWAIGDGQWPKIEAELCLVIQVTESLTLKWTVLSINEKEDFLHEMLIKLAECRCVSFETNCLIHLTRVDNNSAGDSVFYTVVAFSWFCNCAG